MKSPEPERMPAIPSIDKAVLFLKDPEGMVEKNLRLCLPRASVHVFPGLPSGGDKMHVALYLARCLEQAACPLEANRCFEESFRHPLLRDNSGVDPDGRIVLHPGSGGQDKNYPPDFWSDLIVSFRREFSMGRKRLLVLLGPAEERLYPFFIECLKEEGEGIIVSPGSSELISILGKASLYVGHDSGITHLAAMCGAPTIAIFRLTSVEMWGPLGPRVKVFRNQDSGAHLVAGIVGEALNIVGKNNG